MSAPREASLTAARSLTFPVAFRMHRTSSHFRVPRPMLASRATSRCASHACPGPPGAGRLPLFKGQTACRSETPLSRSSVPRGVSPRGVATLLPWPGFAHGSRTRFAPSNRVLPSVSRSRQRARDAVPVLAHSVPKGSLQSLRRAVRRARRADLCSPHSLVFKDEYPRLARCRLGKSSRSS